MHVHNDFSMYVKGSIPVSAVHRSSTGAGSQGSGGGVDPVYLHQQRAEHPVHGMVPGAGAVPSFPSSLYSVLCGVLGGGAEKHINVVQQHDARGHLSRW